MAAKPNVDFLKLVLPSEEEEKEKTFKLVIPNVENGGRLPRKYTGDGQGAKEPVEWYGLPDGTKTLALLVQDLDAPDPSSPIRPWTHWVVFNVPPTLKGLPEGFSRKEEEVGGDYALIKEGINDRKIPGWRGPKPPTAGHRYQFRLFALDDQLHLGNKVMGDKLLDAIEGKVLGEAELVTIF